MGVVVVRTRCNAQVSVHLRAHMQLIIWASDSALAPSAGLTSRYPTTSVPSEGRIQASPGAKHHLTPSRGKRLRGSPTSPPTPSEEGERNLFHLLGVGCPKSRILCKDTPGRVFLVSRTLLPKLPQLQTRSNKLPLTTTIPTLGKDQGGKRMVKRSVQCRSFNVPSRSSKAEPPG